MIFRWLFGIKAGAAADLRPRIAPVVVRIAGAGLMFVVAIVMARLMGPADFGVYSFALSLVTLLAVFAQVGLPTLLVRETARYMVQDRWEALRGLLVRAVTIIVLTSVLACLIAFAVGRLNREVMGLTKVSTIEWALLLIPVMSLTAAAGATLRGLGRIVAGQLPEQVVRPGTLLLLIALAMMTDVSGGITSTQGMRLHVVAAATSFLISVVMLSRLLPPEFRNSSRCSADAAAWTQSMLPLGLLAGFQVAINQMDTLILGLYVPSEQLGYYRVAWQGASVVNLILFAIGMSIAPTVARLNAEGRIQDLQALVCSSGRIAFLLACAIAAMYLVVGKFLIGVVFGERYLEAWVPMIILASGQAGLAASGWSAIVLNMTGNERNTAAITALAATANVLILFFLIPRFGIHGAAAATAFTLTTWKLAMSVVARRRTGISTGVFSRQGVREGR